MANNVINKEQFNKQAENYSNWFVTRNIIYLQKYFEFCDISADDTVFDAACGSGDFSIYAAKNCKFSAGIDISDKLIEVARNYAADFNIDNIEFLCGSFEDMEISRNYSAVVCRMAFHHFEKYEEIFKKLVELTAKSGKLGIQDVIAYEDQDVQEFFEEFEKLVDSSHHRTLRKDEFTKQLELNGISIIKTMDLERDINVKQYMSHACQSEEGKKKIEELLSRGLADDKISQYLFQKDGEYYFKRTIFLVLGSK